jgi:hypothetical protein
MKYEVERVNDTAGEPSIVEMTAKAIEILSKNPKGFFLFVEGRSSPKNKLLLAFIRVLRAEFLKTKGYLNLRGM